MYLALKEIKHEKLRYSLIISMIVLISYLIFILTSLALGLAQQNTSAIESWNFKQIILNKDSDIALRQSLLSEKQVEALKIDNNKEALIGQASIVAKSSGKENISANFIGVKKEQFLYRELKLSSGKLPTTSHEVVVDSSFADKGYKIGDKIYFNSLKTPYKITGFVKNAKLSVALVVYGLLSAWPELKSVTPNFVASALITKNNNYSVPSSGLGSYSKQTLIDNLPGYSAQNKTFTFMIAFLMVISLIVIAVFLYIITIQKLPNFAVLRVQGISNKFLIKNTINQSLILVISGLAIGALLAMITAIAIPNSVPMSFNIPLLGLVSLGLIITSVLGSLIPVQTILHIDPVKAIS